MSRISTRLGAPMFPVFARAALAAAFLTALCAGRSHSRGILVRFLASPAEDSVARYDIYRSLPGDSAAARIGSLPAAPGADTLAWPDSAAAKGVAYRYAIRAVTSNGWESDPSDSTWIGAPRLALPDTLRIPAGGPARFVLPPEAHPLKGHAPLLLSADREDRVRLHHDTAAGALELHARDHRTDTFRVVIAAAYHGKFQDADTVVVLLEGTATTALAAAPRGGPALRAGFRRAGRSEGGNSGMPVTAVPAGGRIRLYDPAGRRVGDIPR